MTKAYEVLRRGFDPGKDIPKYDAAVVELISRLPQSENGYEWKRRGQTDWRKADGKPELRDTLLDKQVSVGDAIYARRPKGSTYVLRAIDIADPAPQCPDPYATQGVETLWSDLYASIEEVGLSDTHEVVFMGIYNCRRIDGSSSWSQHAYRNALDFRIRRKGTNTSIDTSATTQVVNRIRAKGNAAEILWQTSGHTYHAHCTGAPKRYGTPACA